MMPTSLSSMGPSFTVSGSLQVKPSSRLRMSWVLPQGHTCSSRSPENAAISSFSRVRTTDGQPM